MKRLIIFSSLYFFISLSAIIINIPADQPTIQSGINVAVNNDTVLVQPNTYFENINFSGKLVTVASLFLTTQDTSYIYNTIIDGSQPANPERGSVVTFESGENSTSILSGFTIQNGIGNISTWIEIGVIAQCGGGISCTDSSPTLYNLRIINNSLADCGINFGGGISCYNSSPNLINLVIANNLSSDTNYNHGGGISCVNYSSPDLSNVIVLNNGVMNGSTNKGGGIYVDHYSSPTMNDVTISDNYTSDGEWNNGGGIACYNYSSPILTNVIISNNNASEGQGGGILCSYFSSPFLDNVSLLNNNAASGGGIHCSTVSNPSINNTVIDNNSASHNGGGVLFTNSSSPNLNNVEITNNYAEAGYGGGIYCSNDSSPILENIRITNNTSNWNGGGILLANDCSPTLENVVISNNSAVRAGGGIYCDNGSSPNLTNVSVKNNNSNWNGGGIWLWYNSSPTLENVIIKNNGADNAGGGLYCETNSCPSLENVTIVENNANYCGGGIYCQTNSSLIFNNVNKSSVYSNSTDQRGFGSDIYSQECGIINVIVDTFTIMNPSDFYASPIDNFSFDILSSIEDNLINADLYVSVDGNDSNIGTDPNLPLKTISYALKRIYSDSSNHNIIYLSPGVYSSYTNGETFPLKWNNYVSLSGNRESATILDADNSARVMEFVHVTDATIKNIQVINGYASGIGQNNYGGGILCYLHSNPQFENVTISDNYAATYGGGISCDYISSPNLRNTLITNNSSGISGGGVSCNYGSCPTFTNTTFSGNSADSGGGALFTYLGCYPTFKNSVLWNNSLDPFSDYNLPIITYSNVEGGFTGVGNINENPQFINSGDYPYALEFNSPCIDSGTPDTTGLFLPPWDILYNDRIFDGDGDGIAIIDMGCYEFGADSVSTNQHQIPYIDYQLTNYPNPFNPTTIIAFSIPHTAQVSLSIFNLKGQKIKNIINSEYSKGTYNIIWNGIDDLDKPVSSGVYLYKLNVNGKTEAIKKCLLLK